MDAWKKQNDTTVILMLYICRVCCISCCCYHQLLLLSLCFATCCGGTINVNRNQGVIKSEAKEDLHCVDPCQKHSGHDQLAKLAIGVLVRV